MKIPKEIDEILGRMIADGHEIYAVGGAVRDEVMARQTSDFDFATSSNVSDLVKHIPVTTSIDEYYGILNFRIDDYTVEIARMRQDSDYTGRHSNVSFIDDITIDLQRRDFTINALAVKLPDGQIVDQHGGLNDIRRRQIRTVGDPNIRFREDAFRIIRAVSFSLRLEFGIEEETKKAIMDNASIVSNLSPGLVGKELLKLIRHENRLKIGDILCDLRLFAHIFGFEKNIERTVDDTFSEEEALCYLLYKKGVTSDNISQLLLQYSFPRKLRNSTVELYNAIDTIAQFESYTEWEIFQTIRHFDFNRLEVICRSLDVPFDGIKAMFPGVDLDLSVTGDDIADLTKDQKNVGDILDKIEFLRYKSTVKSLSHARELIRCGFPEIKRSQ